MTRTPTAAEIEALRQSIDCCDERALAILDRLSPAPEPEVDEATVWTRKVLETWHSDDHTPVYDPQYASDVKAASAVIAELIASKDGELANLKECWNECGAELATLRAENERYSEALNAIVDRGPERAAKWEGMTAKDIALSVLKAAERNTAEPDDKGIPDRDYSDAKATDALKEAVALSRKHTDSEYGRVHTDGSRSGGMPPGTNAGAVEVTQAAATSAQIYADFHCEDGSFNVIVAERLAAEFDRVRTEAEARGRREALNAIEQFVGDSAVWKQPQGGIAAIRKRIMMGGE